MTLGEKLQFLRKEKGMSQEKLAAELEVSRQAVSKWELDLTLPETENIIKIGKIFQVSYDYLLAEETAEKDNISDVPPQKESGTYTENIVMFLKKYGYFSGYILSAVSAYCLIGYSIALAGVNKMMQPLGFTESAGANIVKAGSPIVWLLCFYIILSAAGTAGGIILAKYLKKKTEKYRV